MSVTFSLTMESKVAATFMVFSMPLVNSSNGQPKHFSPLLNSELSDPLYFYKSDDDQKLVNSVSKDSRQKHTCTCSTIHQCVTVSVCVCFNPSNQKISLPGSINLFLIVDQNCDSNRQHPCRHEEIKETLVTT